MFLIPKKGLSVIDPATMRALKEEGEQVKGNASYWVRQIAAGDVQEIKATQPLQPAPTTPKAPKAPKTNKKGAE